ncbi:hypothetical protein [Micromonospora sp. NPDC023814]|uniref:hypothetical protein n=1 Tax=Micromonospora sp. NPDC023814 TaxID=3154596 RepID=UPI0033F01F8E
MGKVVRGGRGARAVPMGKPQPAEDPARSNRTLDRERVRQERSDEAAREAHTKTVEGTQHRTS